MQKPLLKGSKAPPYSASRLFLQCGLLCLAGISEVVAGVLWSHAFGTGVGMAAVAAGLVCLAYGACQKELSACPATRLPHQQQGPPYMRRRSMLIVNLIGGFALLLILVRAASPDPGISTASAFPEACSKLQGCARVAESHPHRQGQESPLRLRTGLEAARHEAAAWISAQPRAEVLSDVAEGGGTGARVIHARFVSFLWGFADDFWVRLSCAGDSRTVVEVMGQLRLGVGDLEVNPTRNRLFLGAMRARAAAGKFPKGPCQAKADSQDQQV